MVSVRVESPQQADRRLRGVIASAQFRIFVGLYCWVEVPAHRFPASISRGALAVVGDGDSWSELIPLDRNRDDGERFVLFQFHFTPSIDNSGFVGWLASHLKKELGTGVFVTCGYNGRRGGIYDYWGVPAEVGEAALDAVRRLRAGDGATDG